MSDVVNGTPENGTSNGNVQPVPTPRLKTRYQEEIVPALMKEFSYSNVMQVPRLTKIAVNIGLGEALQNSKAIEAATGDLATITGQKPVVTKARQSIAVYKLREGMPIGAMVTLRGNRMWDFLDRIIGIVLPRQRDFQGISPDSFDGRGNYSLGLREQLVFPEIDYDKIDKIRGMELTIVTTANTDEEARRMLALMDMPFKRG
jgi:large subunit ribosomal protein L5